MLMKKVAFSALLIISTMTAMAQQKLSYAYDAAGNRTSRTIVMRARNANASDQEKTVEKSISMVADRQLKIYPNPVKDRLNIQLAHFDNKSVGTVLLYDTSGKMLYNQQITREDFFVDMSQYPKGYYMLRILINDEQSMWKIIKE